MSDRMHIPAVPAERSRPGMSTGRITAAALQIVDTEGSRALTMRRLGHALDRKVMTLYRYVPSKDALLDGVVARVLTDLAINPAAADWRQELRDLAASFRGLALAHPNAVPLRALNKVTRGRAVGSLDLLEDVAYPGGGPDVQAERNQAADAVTGALAGLPFPQRVVIVLHHFEGLSYAEVASVTGSTVPAVRSHLFRARRTLATALEEWR